MTPYPFFSVCKKYEIAGVVITPNETMDAPDAMAPALNACANIGEEMRVS